MNSRAVLRSTAISDLDDIASYIQNNSPDSAIRFLDAADKAFALLANAPEMGTLCHLESPGPGNIRLWTIKGFQNFVVVYQPIDQGVEILRVLHGTRDIDTLLSDM